MVLRKQKFSVPTQIHFGPGVLENLKDLISHTEKVFLVSDAGVEKAGITEKVAALLEERGVQHCLYTNITPNPTAAQVKEAHRELKAFGASTVISLGGGSPLDVGKVLAALATNEGKLEEYQWEGRPFENPPLLSIAIPTTAGTGSEVTGMSVIIDRNVKRAVLGPAIYPRVALVDPELMVTLPADLTASTGLDALSHAVEAYVGKNSSPITDALALEAIGLLGRYLWRAVADGQDLKARDRVALASTLAGLAMDQAGLGIVHSLAGPLGGFFDVPHGLSNAILLPYGMRFNAMAAPEKYARIAQALGVDTRDLERWHGAIAAVEAVVCLVKEMSLTWDLKEYGVTGDRVEEMGRAAAEMRLMLNNPRQATAKQCEQIFMSVLERRDPSFEDITD